MWHSGKEPACNVEDPRDAGLTEQPHMHTLLLKINSVMSVSGVEQVIQLYIYMYLFFFFDYFSTCVVLSCSVMSHSLQPHGL